MKEKKSAGYREDYKGIRMLRNIVVSPEFTTLGGSAGVNLILEKNVALGCNTCLASNAPYLQKMDKYLEDIQYFASKYGTNGSGMIGELKSSFNKLIGAAFQIRVINADRERFIGARFDESVIDAGNEDDLGNITNVLEADKPSQCRFDISIGTGSGVQLYEFKSWGQNTKTAFMASTNTRAKFANQLKAYFSNENVTTLDQIHYFFDGRRLSEKDAKEIVQKVLQERATGSTGWFTSGDATLISQLKLLFEVTTEAQFVTKISSTTNTVYNFVNVK